MSDAAVVARALEFSYRTRRALAGVDFEVAPGEIFGFLGPNGGGKTTLFRILATLLPAQRGTVEIDGLDLAADAAGVRRRLGVVFQSPALDLQLTVGENLLHQGHLYGLAGADLAGRIGARPGPLRARRPRPGPSERRCRAGCGGGWSWPRRSSTGPRSCSSTSRRPASTRGRGGACGRPWPPSPPTG